MIAMFFVYIVFRWFCGLILCWARGNPGVWSHLNLLEAAVFLHACHVSVPLDRQVPLFYPVNVIRLIASKFICTFLVLCEFLKRSGSQPFETHGPLMSFLTRSRTTTGNWLTHCTTLCYVYLNIRFTTSFLKVLNTWLSGTTRYSV